MPVVRPAGGLQAHKPPLLFTVDGIEKGASKRCFSVPGISPTSSASFRIFHEVRQQLKWLYRAIKYSPIGFFNKLIL